MLLSLVQASKEARVFKIVGRIAPPAPWGEKSYVR
jgi:hypothetical protein